MTPRPLLRASLVLVALLLVAAPARAENDGLPSARAVFDRYVEVTNSSKVEEHSKRKLLGSFSIPAQGLSGNLVVWQKAPNLFYSEVELAGVGKIREGFDGTTAWSLDPLQGPQVLTGDAALQKQTQANYWAPLYRDEDIEEATVIGVATFEGEECYEVDLTRKGGDRSKEYFSVETGLMMGGTMEIASPVGKFPARLIMSGYEDFGGMIVPTRATTAVMGMQQVILTDEILHEDFDDSIFALPAEIEALVQD